jgi:hypothetical protein
MNLNPSMLCRLERSGRCLTLSLIDVDPKDQNIITDWKVWKLRAGNSENLIVNKASKLRARYLRRAKQTLNI